MNGRVKRMWINALRSGKYKQGKNQLRIGANQFCCLGVLCDLYAKKHTKIGWSEIGYTFKSWLFGFTSTSLPEEVQQWAGLDSDDPIISPNGKIRSAAQNNDDGRTFKQIARLIERNL